jgi:hypothetical protein
VTSTDMPISSAQAATIGNTGTTRWFALGAVVGPILFAVSWAVLGFLSPGYTLWGTRIAPYSPISQPVSGLGLGPTAPFMNTAFVLCGTPLLAGVVGIFQSIREMNPLARWSCIAMLALTHWPSLVWHLYPGVDVPSFRGFLARPRKPVAEFPGRRVVASRIPRWRGFGSRLLFGRQLTPVLVVLFFATFHRAASGAGPGVGGLTQRVLIVEVHAWFVALGWLIFASSSGVLRYT